MKFLLLISLIFPALACSPEGELTRTLHAPHPKYLDRLSPEAQPLTAAPSAPIPEIRLDPGLPDTCLTASMKPLCISCDESGVLILRCYEYSSVFPAEDDCHHDKDSIKCLMKNPPFALFLNYKNSPEELFRENLKTWIATVHQIWDEKFSEDERKEADRIIASLESLSDIFTSQTTREDKDNQNFFSAFELPKGKEALALGFLAKLERDRSMGKLKLSEVMKDFEELIDQTHGPSPLFEKFSTMSLEGLED